MKKRNIALSAITIFMLGTNAYAGKIITDADVSDQNNIIVEENKQFGFGGWNFDNVDVRIVNISDFSTAVPGSEFDTTTGIYTEMGADMSFESDVKNAEGTVMGHLHGKDWPVGEPAGIKIINGDTKTSHGKPENCIMTSSYQEGGYLDVFASGGDPVPVICSSPWQSHKRYKINLLPTTVEGVAEGTYGKPVDISFNLDPTDDNATIRRYQVLQKVNNYTGMRLDGIKIEVLDENGTVNDALTLSLGEGEGEDENGTVDGTIDIWGVGDMANMSHGLWGPYEEDRFDNGFFDYQGVYYDVNLTENNQTIEYIGPMLGGNYQELFGNWLPSIWEPTGIFFDEDHNPATDNILQAFLGVAPGHTERAWYKSSYVLADPEVPTSKPTYTWEEATEQDFIDWSGDWYNEGPIEDVLNLGLNYIINVGLNADIGETFTLRITPHVDTNQTPPSSYRATKNDFNGDGIADILWTDPSTGEVSIWYMNSDGTYTDTPFNDNLSLVTGTGDYNNDGIADILWRDPSTGEVSIWYMNSDGLDIDKSIRTVSFNWNIEGTADYNNDGIADILWREASGGRVIIWYMESDGTYTNPTIGSVSAAWNIEGTADYNNDGIADILWQKLSDGRVVIWYMESDKTYTNPTTGFVSGTKVVVETADYNNDGNADILWKDSVSGEVSIWYMNSDGTYTDTIIDPIV